MGVTKERDGLTIAETIESFHTDKIQKMTDEWGGVEPTGKKMGVVKLILDKGVKTTVVGTVYGLDFEIEEEKYKVNVFFDYYNKRLKVQDYECHDYGGMLQRLAWLSEANNFDKIFLKAKMEDFQQFLSHGYMMEGVIKYYFNGKDAYVLSRFSSESRLKSKELINESKIIEDIIYNSGEAKQRAIANDIEFVHASQEHIPELVLIYRQVFETYPSPLTNPDYIESVMNKDVYFMLAKQNGEPLAAASAEVHTKYSNAEMTDCATVPAAQGKGVMQGILVELEKLVRDKGIQTAYTLARAQSIGMNKSFFRLNYEYCGRLIKNCDIFGQFEDLNIWVKKL